MRARTVATLLCAVLVGQLTVGPAYAQPAPSAPPAEEVDVAPLMKGLPAPWSGLLVKEGRFVKMLRLQIDLDEMNYKLQRREQMHQEMSAIYKDSLAKAQAELNKRVKPEPWYKSHWLLFCLGIVVGMGATIGAVVGATHLNSK